MEKEDFYNAIKGKGFSEKEIIEGLRTVKAEFPYFQAAQIFYFKKIKDFNQNTNGILNKIAISVPDRKKLYYFLKEKRGKNLIQENFDFEKEDQTDILPKNDAEIPLKNSLIDKFLAANPGTLIRKQESDIESNVSENEILGNSVREDEDIVTETLAMIYLQQKKYDRALNAFQMLSLKYPEKSVYFASRIKEIEGLKNIK